MRRTKEEAELTRQSLLEAALRVFSQKGYAATRLEDVAEAAQVTRGAIYHHFGGKAELFRALVEEASEVGSEAIQQAIQEGGEFLDVGRRVLVNSLKLLQENSRYRQVAALSLFEASGTPELAQYHQQRMGAMAQEIEQIASYFRIGVESGAVRSDLDPIIAAQAFYAYQNGLALMWLMNPHSISIASDAEALADVLIRGIAGERQR